MLEQSIQGLGDEAQFVLLFVISPSAMASAEAIEPTLSAAVFRRQTTSSRTTSRSSASQSRFVSSGRSCHELVHPSGLELDQINMEEPTSTRRYTSRYSCPFLHRRAQKVRQTRGSTVRSCGRSH